VELTLSGADERLSYGVLFNVLLLMEVILMSLCVNNFQNLAYIQELKSTQQGYMVRHEKHAGEEITYMHYNAC
jgi:hypothetical protein